MNKNDTLEKSQSITLLRKGTRVKFGLVVLTDGDPVIIPIEEITITDISVDAEVLKRMIGHYLKDRDIKYESYSALLEVYDLYEQDFISNKRLFTGDQNLLTESDDSLFKIYAFLHGMGLNAQKLRSRNKRA